MARVTKGGLAWATAAFVALVAGAWVASGRLALIAQTSPTTLTKPTIRWFGPYGITPNDTARFNYTNLGVEAVRIEWAFTGAETGELVCGNIGKPTTVAPGKGTHWDYSQTIDPVTKQEVAHCDGDRVFHIAPGETYFDAQNRHGLVSWIFIEHATRRGERLAVDLPTVEVFNSMVMPDGSKSMTFGRLMDVIHANPTAPPDLALQKLLAGAPQ